LSGEGKAALGTPCKRARGNTRVSRGLCRGFRRTPPRPL